MWKVQILRFSDSKIIKEVLAPTESAANKIDGGININLNHFEYYTKIIKGE